MTSDPVITKTGSSQRSIQQLNSGLLVECGNVDQPGFQVRQRVTRGQHDFMRPGARQQ